MITKLIDGESFDDIRAIRMHKITDGGGHEEVLIKDLTKEELIDVARTYYISLQDATKKMEVFVNKLEEKLNQK